MAPAGSVRFTLVNNTNFDLTPFVGDGQSSTAVSQGGKMGTAPVEVTARDTTGAAGILKTDAGVTDTVRAMVAYESPHDKLVLVLWVEYLESAGINKAMAAIWDKDPSVIPRVDVKILDTMKESNNNIKNPISKPWIDSLGKDRVMAIKCAITKGANAEAQFTFTTN